MASPFKFSLWFLLALIILWLLSKFASRLLAWILSRIIGASIRFTFGGWNCLRNVVVNFRKGPVESVSVGEIRLSLRQSLVKLGVGFISRDPKLQVLICNLEVVLRSSNKSTQKRKSKRSHTSGRGKWMVVANVARFLSLSITEFVVKTPKATIEVKELRVGISKDGGSEPALFVKLHLLPIVVHLGKPRVSYDESSNFNESGHTLAGQASVASTEKTSSPFYCEEFILSTEFGHQRDAGVIIKNIEIISGDVNLNLNEELFLKKKGSADTFAHAREVVEAGVDSNTVKKPQKKQAAIFCLTKYASIIPEKLNFNLPKLDVKFVHKEHDLVVENNIIGIQVKTIKSRSIEDVGESTRLDIQLDFSEIYLFREASISVMEMQKLDVVSSAYIPLQPTSPIRSEIDVKIGRALCNIIMNRLKPWMHLQSSKRKKMVLQDRSCKPDRLQSTESNAIMWVCNVSVPEMTIMLYNLSGSPLYQGCSQSSHLFANNISSTGTSMHMELGELNLHMPDEYQECSKESHNGVETTNTGSFMHIAKVSLDWGKKDMESLEEDVRKFKMVLLVDVSSMAIDLNFKRIESLTLTSMSFKSFLKSLSSSKKRQQNRGEDSSKPSGKGIQLLKFNLERCSVNLIGDVGLENTVVADPKRVNYGSQGGRVIISVSANGTPRSANIMSTISDECKKLKYSVSLDMFHFSLCMNKEKRSTQMELERARSFYQEYLDDDRPGTIVALFDMQNTKFLRRFGGLKDIGICSLFSATNITVRWEPDVHIALFELVLHVNLLIHNQKSRELDDTFMEDTSSVRGNEHKKENTLESKQYEKQKKKGESLFAVDVETLSISAEVGDGVDIMVQVHSIFSENASIGVLFEGLMLSFNEARVLKSSRVQISRIPSVSAGSSDAKVETGTVWDWVIQGLDANVCMPYRLQLRAIDDSIEEMFRALKLVTSAKTNMTFPTKKESAKPKKSSSTKCGRVKFCIRKLTVDIEEEPLQGWLDEHYQLMKNEACELAVRLKFLDELYSKSSQCAENPEAGDSPHEGKIIYNGEEIDVQDSSVRQKMEEEVYKQSFQSYYQACKNLVVSEGSGACRKGFQAGFKPSTARTFLFSISATELDVSLTRIIGGDEGMIEIIQNLDPASREYDIPFSRLYGSNILLHTGSLSVQLRNYTFPLFLGTSGKCEGRLVLAQQATCFQPQIYQNVFIGRWRKICMLRSASGTTPPMKTYLDLPLHFHKAEVSFGVGFEPSFADISYAFTVALRKANLSIRNPNATNVQPPKKERSLPWWDEMRNYIHGNVILFISETKWNILATTDPYERHDKLQIVSGHMEIQQSDGRINVAAKDFKIFLSSLETLLKNTNIKLPIDRPIALLEVPVFTLEVTMEWDCDSGNPMNHYLFALPNEGVHREKLFDPFRSTSLSLRLNFSLRPSLSSRENQSQSSATGDDAFMDGSAYCTTSKSDIVSVDSPIVTFGSHDFAWLTKFWNLNFLPPHKLRMFSRWPRFGVPRIPRSGNLSLDRVITEFMFRIDSTPTCIRNMPLDDDDPAKGLTFKMTRLKYELCLSRGKQKFTFESKRDLLDLVYQGLDLHMPKAYLDKEDCMSVAKVIQMTKKSLKSASMDRAMNEKCGNMNSRSEKHHYDGFLLSSDYFTIRRQAQKADPERLLAWQEAGRRNLEMKYVKSEFENGSDSDKHAWSDPSDDDGYNVVIADNCQRIFVYGLKLLWNLENRDAIWSWVGGISKAFGPPKPSPSRQYEQRKLLEGNQVVDRSEMPQDDMSNLQSVNQGASPSPQHAETSGSVSSPLHVAKIENSTSGEVAKNGSNDDSEEEGTLHFMVNIIEPQFNLHSEEANGRFLLAAVSGRVLARSFHSVLHVGYEIIEQALGTENVNAPECQPEMTWNRMEFSVMLEHVQAHVAPTDVDPGAGLQWLPKIHRSSPKVKRTGALLERVFTPCHMYFRYTRHKGETADLKMKPLKELTFNSHNITATMTSRQFQVMLDVLTNLLFSRVPKPRKSSLLFSGDNDEDIEEEADAVVPDGIEEVELARINLEQKEREQNLLLYDIRKLSSHGGDTSGDICLEKEGDLWMVNGGRSTLVQGLKKELGNAKKLRKTASTSLRTALQKAAQLRLMEKEKNKTPSSAMRVSMQINKVVWSMLADGKSCAEAEISDMIYDFERDYKDFGIARFTTKYFVVRNCMPNAKFDMILSPWNPPSEWGKKVMLRVDTKQGAPKDGNSPIENFQVEIHPLKIHLSEMLYRVIWGYFFPEEEQDSQRRQEVWKVSTTAGSKRVKKGSSISEVSGSSSHSAKEFEVSSKSNPSLAPFASGTSQSSPHADPSQNLKANAVGCANPKLRRTSSLDRTWEENVAESVVNELILQAHSSSISSSRSGPLGLEQKDDQTKSKSNEMKPIKSGHASQEEKKVGKIQDEKRSRPRVMKEFHNIKISQVELLVTYEGPPLSVNELRLLMDTFHRVDFTGTWSRLFSRVKKHVIWGVLKSVTGMQGKKFKARSHSHGEPNLAGVPKNDLNSSDSDEDLSGQHPITWAKRPSDGAGDGFVTSIKGLFNSQRRKAKAFVLRTMRGEEENELSGDWNESDIEFSPFARQLTIMKAKKLIRQHTKRLHSRGQKGSSSQKDSSLSLPRETTIFESNSSSDSSSSEDSHE